MFLLVFVTELPLPALIDLAKCLANYLAQPTNEQWDGHAQLHGRAADVDALAGAVRVIGVFFGYLVLVTFAAGRQGLGALPGHADARGGPR